jgi:hypothetical protein
MRLTKRILVLAATLLLAAMASSNASHAVAPLVLPNPVLALSGAPEPFTTGGKNFLRYTYYVDNSTAYPDAMFAPAPALPPCGANTRAARTWVDFFDQRGKRLNGFCALGKAANLNKIWFALEENEVPPSWVYIELNDRETNTKYKSNLAETTQ